MNIEEVRDFALSLAGVEESCPFGPGTLVFKVNQKMFLLVPLDEEGLRFNVKCTPDLGIQQRLDYPDTILPGYHMNKVHWNTIVGDDGRLTSDQLRQFVLDSYELVKQPKSKKGLPKS